MNNLLAKCYFINVNDIDQPTFQKLVNSFATAFNTEKPIFEEFIHTQNENTYDEQKQSIWQAKITTSNVHILHLFHFRQAAQAFSDYNDFGFADFEVLQKKK
jgi:hypothetical protein